MTRVKLLRHLAIWPCSGGMDHLHGLAPKPMLVAWQAHYTGTGAWRAGEQLVPRGTFPGHLLQAGTLARANKKDIETLCKKLGIWITGRTRQGMEDDLGGAFTLALAQHNAAGAAAAAAPTAAAAAPAAAAAAPAAAAASAAAAPAAPAAAPAAPAAAPGARARRASARLRARLALSGDDEDEDEEEEEVPSQERRRIVRRSKRRRVQRVIN